MKGWRKREIPEKTRRSTASSGTIPTCENPEKPGRGLNPDWLATVATRERVRERERERKEKIIVQSLDSGKKCYLMRKTQDDTLIHKILFIISLHYRADEGEARSGVAPECKSGENGRSPRKHSDQRYRQARFLPAKIRGASPPGIEQGSPRWEVSSLTTTPTLPSVNIRINSAANMVLFQFVDRELDTYICMVQSERPTGHPETLNDQGPCSTDYSHHALVLRSVAIPGAAIIRATQLFLANDFGCLGGIVRLSGVQWAALNSVVLRANEGEARRQCSSSGKQKARKLEIPEKTRRPTP
ncbi:hypothetical protein PR048_003239 [Dryococelus australis]|uniref:Uncharacterized protein n=1 Tax=Dryococelus australis TaxID=614101 RepID=A0ABQ9IMI3_9NEOP|nr:hypothetical protein PR048_003239 [Dryococelus australis]